MKNFKTIFLIALCGVLLTGVSFLKDIYAQQPTADEENAIGGAAQYVGKLDIKDSPYFAHPDFYNMQSNDHLLILSKFKTYQQTTEYSCGPAAALMVTEYLTGAPLHSEMEMVKVMNTSQYNGTTTKGIRKYFQEIGWQVKSSADTSSPEDYFAFLEFVKNNLKSNTPILVENVDWGGHWRIIIGYDTMGTDFQGDDVLIMADPYDVSDHLQDGYNVVPAEKFFYMWFDHQLFSKNEQNKQWLTAKPKA